MYLQNSWYVAAWDHEVGDGEAHALGTVAREDVAEIAGGNDEVHLPVR